MSNGKRRWVVELTSRVANPCVLRRDGPTNGQIVLAELVFEEFAQPRCPISLRECSHLNVLASRRPLTRSLETNLGEGFPLLLRTEKTRLGFPRSLQPSPFPRSTDRSQGYTES
jgi:hypothetical protein